MRQNNETETLFHNYPDILTSKQLQDALGIGRAGVLKLLSSGQIESFKIGNTYKIPRTALLAYIERACPGREEEIR